MRLQRLAFLIAIAAFTMAASPAMAQESMNLKALRIARQHFPGRSGARRIVVSEVPGATANEKRIVAFRVVADGIPPDTYVVFAREGSGWKSLGLSNDREGRRVVAQKQRRGRK